MPRLVRIAPLTLALLCGAGCAPEENYVTPLTARLPVVPGIACIPETGYTTYVLDLFRYEGPTDDRSPTSGTRCGYCAEGSQECTHLARTCRCSGPRATPADIEDAIRGARFDDVPADQPLCVRLIAFEDVREGATTGPGESCDCPAPSQVLIERPGVCALSQVGAANESGAPLQLTQFVCRDPPRLDGGTPDCDEVRDLCERTRFREWCDLVAIVCENAIGPSLSQCATFSPPAPAE